MTVRVVIVDDEDLARRGIRSRLRRFEDAEVIAECRNGADAIETIRRISDGESVTSLFAEQNSNF